MREITTTCCIAGGGPAGMMLGFLLARAGVDVIVLEKHADFLRDFRGDTIHPSTLQLMHELGLLEDFLKLPHSAVSTIAMRFGNETIQFADFSHLPVAAPFVAMMPQWDFLDFLADRGHEQPRFSLMMSAKAEGLIEQAGKVTGLTGHDGTGPFSIRADLVVAADGRRSDIRAASGLKSIDIGAPMDVLWFRLPKEAGDSGQTGGQVANGRLLVTLDRGDYWQSAFVIPKGKFEALRAAGLPAFRAGIVRMAPWLADRMQAIQDWQEIKLLTVAVDRLETWWRPGLLCIGDAAHAMSPIGGVGVNLAVQDAVAAANRLAAPLRERRLDDSDLAAVQERREFPTRATQRIQVIAQNNIISPLLARSESDAPLGPPLLVRLFDWLPLLRRLPARLVGMGVTPEHIGPDLAPRVN
ncbi:MAG: FAD-dependent oxidoreductase [Bosea sp. (in: a-proteobacteria)]|uniref:FAD-dependent oxidoreductase n=1 Tax=Bosea sp. (in: a-proteobacteria) TaxID=1871050 RepID=UPI0027326CB8|nr:FAD-dependent oxidoreductase [Bosea sp. (in: a-proteobacteria)]MDP3256609.1 FAD-dependent oxidoreductase [Bosea sp. (in: a-proteobacteria)]MDP3319865.1 FAD-dependent oxidoreductase [Bosea sp. (in: a-proteobacteria)]